MKTQRNDMFGEKVLDSMMAEIQEDRTEQWPGVTNLIYCLTKAYWERTIGRPEVNHRTKLYFTTGLAIERALLENWKGAEQLTGEFEGIFYHIDGFDPESKSVVELKSTRQGIAKGTIKGGDKRPIQVSDYSEFWMQQIAAYCYIMGVMDAKLVVLHLIAPELLAWDLSFDNIDLISNWMMLQSRRSDLMHAVETETPPTPFTTNKDWECGNCIWLAMCNAQKVVG